MIISLAAVIVAARFWYLEEQGNFHPITPGKAYRSAQLDQDELEDYIGKFGIRSIINLQGKHDGERWYTEEVLICRKLGVRYYDLGLSADKTPTADEIQELLRLFHTAPRPVLVHCKAGADRSGLAAAIWQVAIEGRPKSEAKKQLNIRYGHIPFGPTQVLDQFFDKWASATKAKLNTEKMAGEFFNRSEYADKVLE